MSRLSMRGIARRFGQTQALAGVDLDLRPGEVHALIGENGAGKSTLMKVLSGAERPDAGAMTLDGQVYAPSGPADARRRGVVMVYQETALAPHLSVEANALLGAEPARLGWLDQADGRRRVRAALAELGHAEIDPAASAASLGPGPRQVVEIARALLIDVRVLVLDEPTSALARDDTERLFALVRRLRDRGVTVVYISHFLEEVQAVADRFTVLRDGRAVASGDRRELDLDRVIAWMIGRELGEQFPRLPHERGEPILELDAVAGDGLPRRASLTLHKGEVLGLAGLVGAGRTELLRAIFGLAPVRAGAVRVLTNRPGGATPRGRLAAGVGLLSEDRKGEGLALAQPISDNLTYTRLGPYSWLGVLHLGRRAAAVAGWLERLRVRCRGAEQPVGELSGGNQQKVALGRLLHQGADVLLLDEPTRGVDIGSKAEIYRLIAEQTALGKAVLLVSSYLPELLGICDRIAVMTRGVLGPARPTGEWTAEAILAAATAGREGGA